EDGQVVERSGRCAQRRVSKLRFRRPVSSRSLGAVSWSLIRGGLLGDLESWTIESVITLTSG
ncbi:hypothetical protein AMECASPLE_026197, partial [Ameca splendens]